MNARRAQRLAGALLALAIGASLGWCLAEFCDPESDFAPSIVDAGELA